MAGGGGRVDLWCSFLEGYFRMWWVYRLKWLFYWYEIVVVYGFSIFFLGIVWDKFGFLFYKGIKLRWRCCKVVGIVDVKVSVLGKGNIRVRVLRY